jgi:hypothetical protein
MTTNHVSINTGDSSTERTITSQDKTSCFGQVRSDRGRRKCSFKMLVVASLENLCDAFIQDMLSGFMHKLLTVARACSVQCKQRGRRWRNMMQAAVDTPALSRNPDYRSRNEALSLSQASTPTWRTVMTFPRSAVLPVLRHQLTRPPASVRSFSSAMALNGKLKPAARVAGRRQDVWWVYGGVAESLKPG